MSQKIAIYYLIGQFNEWWEEEFFHPQMESLYASGLYDNIDFIEIHVAGGMKPLPYIPDKVKSIHYQKTPYNEERELMRSIHRFASENYQYNILHMHSEGATYRKEHEHFHRKRKWRNVMQYSNISLWKECLELLGFYDCVGADYAYHGNFLEGSYVFRAPHFPGMFWWSKASYFRTLDLDYLKQDVPWERYLAELWIGSKDPKVYQICDTGKNPYEEEIEIDEESTRNRTIEHIEYLKLQIRYRIEYDIFQGKYILL
jgi:hypothetical protein